MGTVQAQCFPARSTRTVWAAWSGIVVTRWTASTSGSASTSSKESYTLSIP